MYVLRIVTSDDDVSHTITHTERNMKHAALSLCLCLVPCTTALAQTDTCFDSIVCPEADCQNPEIRTKSKTKIIFSPAIICDSSGSTAVAAASAVPNDKCSHQTIPNHDQDASSSSTTSSCVSSACASVGAGGSFASACASTNASRILLESVIAKCPNFCTDAEAAYARSDAWVVLARNSPASSVCVEFETDEMPNEIFFHLRLTTCCEWVISTPQGDLTSAGVVDIDSDPTDGIHEWEFCCDSVRPRSTFSITAIDVPLSSWDMNGDGRFNQADVDTVAQIGVTCTGATVFDCLPTTADLDGDGDIDAVDAALLQDYLDCGVDTGIFGDTDQDGDTDCADKAAATVFPLPSSPVIPVYAGQPGYQLELDYDLDGDLDMVDQNAFYTLFFACP